MATPSELLEALERVNVREMFEVVFDKNKKEYAMLNQTQLLKGKKRTGEQIGTYWDYENSEYAAMKFSQNALAGFGNVDLKLTGSFYRGITPSLSGDDVEVESTDSKSGMLEDTYGETIFGLDESNLDIFREVAVIPDFLVLLEQETGLRPG